MTDSAEALLDKALDFLLTSRALLPETLLRAVHLDGQGDWPVHRELLAERADLPEDLYAALADDTSDDVLHALARNASAPTSARIHAAGRIADHWTLAKLATRPFPEVLEVLARRACASLPADTTWEPVASALLSNADLPEPGGRVLLGQALPIVDRDAEVAAARSDSAALDIGQPSQVWPGVQSYLQRHPDVLAELGDSRNPWVLLELARRQDAEPAVIQRVVDTILLPGLAAPHTDEDYLPTCVTTALQVVGARLPESALREVRRTVGTWNVALSSEVVHAVMHGHLQYCQEDLRHALFSAGPVREVLAFITAHPSTSRMRPADESVLGFVSRQDVSTEDALTVHATYGFPCPADAIEARHDRDFAVALVIRLPDLQNGEHDPDVLLDAVAGLLDPGCRGSDAGALHVHPSTIAQLGKRLLELPWAALSELVGGNPTVDAVVADHLGACLATPARATLFRVLSNPENMRGASPSLPQIRETIDATLADASA